MRIVFRADAAISIGTGHIMRCAALAEAVRARGAEVVFITGTPDGHLNDWLTQRGFAVQPLAAGSETDPRPVVELLRHHPPDWLVVDHPRLSAGWEQAVRPYTRQIMVIDDLADRPHDAEMLIDPNYFPDAAARYRHLVPSGCDLRLGPEYALLSPEFKVVHDAQRPVCSGTADHVLVAFGDSDPSGETFKALAAIRHLVRPALHVDVMVDPGNPRAERIAQVCAAMPNTRFHANPNGHTAQLMAQADVALSGGDEHTWERLCAGLPSLVVATEEAHADRSRALADAGYEIYLGRHSEVCVETMAHTLALLLEDADRRRQLSEAGRALVDGRGPDRIAERLMGI